MKGPNRAAVPLLTTAVAMAVLLGGGGAGTMGGIAHSALAHPWHDDRADPLMCAPWDDFLCKYHARNATADRDAHYGAGSAPFLPSDGIAPPGHGPHGWWTPPPGGTAEFPCGVSWPYLAEPANDTHFFAGPYSMHADMERGHLHGPPGPSTGPPVPTARSDTLPTRGLECRHGGEGLSGSAPAAGLDPGAGGALPAASKIGVDDAGRLPAGTTPLYSPETITDENIRERRPAVNGSGSHAVPSVVSVVSLTPDGLYERGDRIEIAVRFTVAVHVSSSGAASGAPYLALDLPDRPAAQYVNGGGSDTLVFAYVVRHDDRHDGLNYTGTSALSDGGGAITGASGSGRHADLALPAPGSPGSLSAGSSLVLGVDPPLHVSHEVSFGGSGRADGKFYDPRGVAVSPLDGRIVVADTGHHRIQVFHPDGTFDFKIGLPPARHGKGDGAFYRPYDVAVALDGRIVVADSGNHRIQVFHPDGTFDFKFSTHSRERPLTPDFIDVDPGGRFIVGSYDSDSFSVFRPDGTYSHAVTGWSGYGAVAASASAKIALAGYHALTVGYANGTGVTSRHGNGIYDGQLAGTTTGIAFDNADRIVVADAGNHRIQVFRPDGTFVSKFGGFGSNDGEFYYPRGVAVSPLDGRIVVADAYNHRIQVFAPSADGEDGNASRHQRQQQPLPPAVTAVTSPLPHGVYGTGDEIALSVHFTRPVVLSGQPPVLALDTGAPSPRNATYAGGNGTAILTFVHEIESGDVADAIEYAGMDALALASGADAISGADSVGANLTLPVPGQPGSLSYAKRLTAQALQGGTLPPSVINVDSLTPDGLYERGDRIEIAVRFTDVVHVSSAGGGAPYLALDLPDRPAAQYVNGSGSDTLVFAYVVRHDDRHDGLNYTGTSALSDGGGAITGASGSGRHADLALPAPGSPGSLSAGSSLVLGVDPPLHVSHEVSFGGSGRADGKLYYPRGVAVSPLDGRIVVAEAYNHRIQVFRPDGTFDFRLGLPDARHGNGDGEFASPYDAAVALDGRIVVADSGNHRIQVFHPDGTFDFKFSTHSRERPLTPYSIDVDPGGRFIVGGGSNSGLSVFRSDGTYSHAVAGWSGSYGAVAASASAKIALAVSPALTVGYANGTGVTSRHGNGIYDGQLAGTPAGIAFDNADWIVAADTGNHRIQVFRPDGTFVSKLGGLGGDDGEFYHPRGVAVSPLDGRIVAADSGNHRIQVFAPGVDGEGGSASRHQRQQSPLPSAVTAVTSPLPHGVYGTGDEIALSVHFTRPVVLSGPPPVLALDTGAPSPRNATYAGGNGTAILTFAHEIESGDMADAIEYAGMDALASGADAISGADSVGANLTLPVPGQPGSLSYAKRLTAQALQDGTLAPGVVNVDSLTPDGLYERGDRIEIAVRFTDVVHVSSSGAASGAPYLALDLPDRPAAQYMNGSGSDTLVFAYVVRHDDRHDGLNYTGTSALSDGGGAITGASGSGRHADLALPAPGSPGSLSAGSSLVLGVDPPLHVSHAFSFGEPGIADGELYDIRGVAVSPLDGRIVVADTQHRIQVFHPDGAFDFRIGPPHARHGNGDGEFNAPYDVAVALDGRIVVADSGNHRIQVFHPNGTFDFKFSTHSRERPLTPYSIDIDPGGRFIVGGSGTSSGFTVFRPDGTYSHAVTGWSGYTVAASASAKIAVAGSHALVVGYANGTGVTSRYGSGIHDGQFAGATPGIAFDNADRIVVADTGNHRIQVFHPNGTFVSKLGGLGSDDGEFYHPRGVAVSPLDGRIVVADTGNHRIQVFAPSADGEGGKANRHQRQQQPLPPAVTAVTSPLPHGVYGTGDEIALSVHFTRPVVLSGQQPVLALDTGAPSPRNAMYAGGNGTAILRFSYTVHPHDRTYDLEYAGPGALAAFGERTITGKVGINGADLVLPEPGTPGSLAYSAAIKLDGAPAHVVSVSPSPSTYGGMPVTLAAGDRMDIDVTFDRPVSVSTYGGALYLLLRVGDSERPASYAAGGSDREGATEDDQRTLTFRYEVGTGEFADALEYASRSALVLNGSAVTDAAGHPADLTLPLPGARGSLSANSSIAVRAPAVVVDPPTGLLGPGGAPNAPRNMTGTVVHDLASGHIDATDGGHGLRLVLNVTGLVAGNSSSSSGSRGNASEGAGSSGGNDTLTFPPDGVVVATSFAEVSFPPGVNATSAPDDGLLDLHVSSIPHDDAVVHDALGYGGSDRVVLRTVVRVGDADARVDFDMPVRISLEGHAGGRAFYAAGANGTIVPIDLLCAADDTDRVHRQLGGAGECQIDTDDGDKVIHTYHMTLFGTAVAESGEPPPPLRTCSVRLASPSLEFTVRPGARSPAAPQDLINSGSMPFAGVNVSATPWYIDAGLAAPSAGAQSLPASLTEVSIRTPDAWRGAVDGDGGGEIGAAGGLAGGHALQLWFRIDLTGHPEVKGAEMAQNVAYSVQCAAGGGGGP